MNVLKNFLLGLLCCLLVISKGVHGQTSEGQENASSSLASITGEMEKMSGLIDLYWDSEKGKIWMAVPDDERELLYYTSLASGLGSNDIGLDRGRLATTYIIRFIPVGDKLLMQAENYSYRASSANPKEKQAITESFASSVLWGFKITSKGNDRILVDGTDFFLQDAVQAAGAIKRSGQGTYKAAPSRSALYKPRTKSFPENTEVEASITYIGEQPGNFIRQIVPDPTAIQLHIHHSFVALPKPGFDLRTFDPRAGVNAISYYDFASPIDQNLEKKILRRHRLVKKSRRSN